MSKVDIDARIELPGLNGARFWAATMIVLYHIVSMPKLQMAPYLQFVPQQFGRIAVPLFFTLSAFALFYGYQGRIQSREQVKKFYLKRFFRIAPLFYVLMIFHYIMAYVLYGKIIGIDYVVSLFLFVFNLIPHLSSGYVAASWSVGAEMLFYAVLPLILMFVTSLRSAIAFFIGSCFVAYQWNTAFIGVPGITNYGHFGLPSNLNFFSGGIVAFYLYKAAVTTQSVDTAKKIGIAAIVFAILGLVLVFSTDRHVLAFAGRPGDKLVRTVPLLLFILGIALCPIQIFANRAAVEFGKMSYSLYLLHPIVIILLIYAGFFELLSSSSLEPGIAFAVATAVVAAFLLPLSAVSYRYIEGPGIRLYRQFDPDRHKGSHTRFVLRFARRKAI